METEDVVEAWRREGIAESFKLAFEEGFKLGVEEGIKQGFVLSVVEVYQARFGTMPEDLRAVVEDTGDKPTLVTWLRLAATRSTDEIGAAIRSFRPS